MKYTIQRYDYYGAQLVTIEFIAANEETARRIVDRLKTVIETENEDMVKRAMKGASNT